MQRHRGQAQFQLPRKIQGPYARRPSTFPFLFNARNVDIPKGRIHSPSETSSKRKTTFQHHTGGSLTAIENLLPSMYKYPVRNEDANIGLKVTNDTSDCKSIHSFSEHLENQFQNTLKFPANMTGNLSLTQSQQNWNLHDKRKGNGTTLKNENEPKNVGMTFVTKNNQVSDESQFRRKENLSRVLTGPVEKVVQWFKLKNYFHILVEVIAYLVDSKPGKLPREKCLVFRDDKSGPSLLVKYYEIDNELPHLEIGTVVKCVGRLTSRNSLQAFKVEQSSEQEKAYSKRLFFISNLVAEEAKAAFLKK